jgi:bifunctional non-homologous end joining protein LigD
MPVPRRANSSTSEPMLAQLADAPLQDPHLVYEPKYDGVRIVARVRPSATLTSRLGNDKTAQFPEVAEALERWGRHLKTTLVVDGEVVALDAKGRPASFLHLQGRIHVGGRGPRRRTAPPDPPAAPVAVAYILFDLLAEGDVDLRGRPLTYRRARLERVFARRPAADAHVLRLSEQVAGDARDLYARIQKAGGEGLIAKRAGSIYHSGRRTPDWRKIKLVQEQEFAIGGWTEPRGSRPHFGALLLGVSTERPEGPPFSDTPERRRAKASASGGGAPREMKYVGSVGTGFDDRELARLMKLLKPIETADCPFVEPPDTAERAHWVTPTLVAQVRFAEWTTDDKLRHPVYLGLRDDKTPGEIVREAAIRLKPDPTSGPDPASEPDSTRIRRIRLKPDPTSGRDVRVGSGFSRTDRARLLDELRGIEDSRRDGTIALPDGGWLAVTNLHKVFWPRQKLTKGDLFRYYVQVAPFILSAVADRPLVMKRYPDGIDSKPFYQHQIDKAPPGVRIERVGDDSRPQLVGGSVLTLLYMTQLASISQDPWFSRVPDTAYPDCAAIDLDPPPDVPFARVLDVARWIRDELARLGVTGVPKTSGASGLHIYVPLPRETPFEAGLLFCQIVATLVASKHPQHATTERAVRARGKRIYVDCMQNAEGKTLATAYSARASEYAGVSTPLTWDEVDAGIAREDFTMQSIPARLESVGDLWARLRTAMPVDLARAARAAHSR